MRVYIPNQQYKFDHPKDMRIIIEYLKENGKVLVSPKTIEDLYYQYSDSVCCGWRTVDSESLKEFADYLTEIEI